MLKNSKQNWKAKIVLLFLSDKEIYILGEKT